MSKKQKKIGKRGLNAAERYLKLMGYKVLDRSWECPAGEVDLVAKDGDVLVFVTVKTRTSIERGLPKESTGPDARARCEKVASYYLCGCRDLDYPVRFDEVSLLVVAEDRALVRHYQNVFGCGCC